MADWKTELDALVKETMAFAKGLRVETPKPRTTVEPSDREEIKQRVANFRAHQQRFNRELEEYASSEWRRILASQREAAGKRPCF